MKEFFKKICHNVWHYEDEDVLIGVYRHWFLFNHKIRTRLRFLYRFH